MIQLIYPCVCAEIPITDDDIDRWGKLLLGVKDGWEGSMVTLIMRPKDHTRAIDEVNFDMELVA